MRFSLLTTYSITKLTSNSQSVIFNNCLLYTSIKSNLEDYLEKAPDVEYLPEENENSAEETNKCAKTKDEAKKDENKTVVAGTVKKELCSPFTGVAAPIEEACDEAFAGKMMGDGYLCLLYTSRCV